MIHIVTAVHNRYQITEKFVKNLMAQTYKDIHLILVDDGSTDGTAEMVCSLLPNTQVITGNGNLWWGGALHEAYLWIKANLSDSPDDFVMFANDDTQFPADYIERAIAILTDRQKTLLTGCGISCHTGKQIDGAVYFDFSTLQAKFENREHGNCASTRSLFFRARDFLEIGGFHPILLPHYASDYEWTIRACQKYGYTVFCDSTLQYFADETTTGDNNYDTLTRKKLFSKRSNSNPFYKFVFIFMVTPPKYLLKAIFIQIGRYFKKINIILKIIKR